MSDKYNILIATHPFGLCGVEPVELLNETGWNIKYSLLGRRLKLNEVGEMLDGIHGVVAGTEPYNEETLSQARDLKVISRVGIGLDNVDFEVCRKKNIIVTYTPEAPSEGVADLTVAQIINLLRGTCISNSLMRQGQWKRTMGKLVKEINIGVLGVGRIGSKVIKRLIPFGANIYACDIKEDVVSKYREIYKQIKWGSKEDLFRQCDLVTIHIPLNKNNYNHVGVKEFGLMKEGSFIVNTSRGPILNEDDLFYFLNNEHLGGAALDVFTKEPYEGPLTQFNNVILTAHIASSANETRYSMELGAAEDCVRVLQGKEPLRPAPDFE